MATGARHAHQIQDFFTFQVHFVPTKITVTANFIQLLALIQWVCPLQKLGNEHFYTSIIVSTARSLTCTNELSRVSLLS